ncbi:MAG: ABC transporter permease [Phycisphaerales bacterium]
MRKTFHVAWREFCSTVLTKGFIIGILMTPVFILIVAGGAVLLGKLKGPRLSGTVAIIDQAGGVADRVERRFSGQDAEFERRRMSRQIADAATQNAAAAGISEKQAEIAAGIAAAQADELLNKADLSVEVLPPTSDIEAEKKGLAEVDVHAKDRPSNQRIAIAVVPRGSVLPDEQGDFAAFDLYTAPRVDPEVQSSIRRKIADAIIDARIDADPRTMSAGLSPESVRAMVNQPSANTVTVTTSGDKKSIGELQVLVPMAFMLLLLMSVMTGGQYLLTTTVEEKSSRVMEVLLSAVSPMQLMVGKICGQMGVGLLILAVYSGAGVGGLMVFSFMHVLNPVLLVYLVIFFFIAFFVIASMMAAAGSAVSEMREAQTLMTPIMIIVMLPWLLWLPISRAPNSLFSTIISFIPGINPFVMIIRLAGSEPVPAWQIPLSILVGLISVLFCAWAAAKIFRIGVLMYGKPPNFRTLVRWVRMA